MKRAGLIVLSICLCMTMVGTAYASSSREVTYRYSKIWSGAVRFLRVDNRFPLVEKAKKDGYILFEYRDRGREKQASFEFVPVVKTNRKYIRITLRIEGMPSYVEKVLLDKFEQKLKTEFGHQPVARLLKKSKKSSEKESDDSEGEGLAGDEIDDGEELEVDEKDLEDSVK